MRSSVESGNGENEGDGRHRNARAIGLPSSAGGGYRAGIIVWCCFTTLACATEVNLTRAGVSGAAPAGVNLVGHVTGSMGLGVAARNTLSVLAAGGRDFEAIDVDPGGGRQGADRTSAHLVADRPAAPYSVNLFHMNPPEVASLVASAPPWLEVVGRANVAVPFWELPRLPVAPPWRELLGAMDLVLAPSRFILGAVEGSCPGVRVVHYPQTVFLPEGVTPNRARFGLPEDAVLFHVGLDVTSDLTRKNPAAVLAAFRAAFDPDAAVKLVVKLRHLRSGHPWADPEPLLAELAATPNTIVIDQDLSYAEALSLAASCDVCVSLHRAEGLSLHLLEAMALGKPVVATARSGNMDFMSEDDACLVGFELVPVQAAHPCYRSAAIGPGQTWAEPRVAEAAAWMRKLADDSGMRQRIGGAALAAVKASRSAALAGGALAAIDAVATTGPRGVKERADRRARWRRFGPPSLPVRVWRSARRLATRLVGEGR